MKILIIYHSEHHQNTEKIAKAMTAKIGAEIKKAKDVNLTEIDNYDIIGFGSGVYHGRFHSEISDIIENLSYQNNKKSFIFSTTGSLSYSKLAHDRIRPSLADKGFNIIGEFSCLGFDTALSSEDINKGKPEKQDLENAERFSETILTK
ncbi:MAG: flavodoxin [Actinobacteria bacterium]|nr:flavodoxin [Actinomycetota bacterium]